MIRKYRSISMIIALCFLLASSAFADDAVLFPLPPTLFLGDHNQAAIVLNYRTEEIHYGDDVIPSTIEDAWVDGENGLYILLAPSPSRLYHWRFGEDGLTLVAVGEAAHAVKPIKSDTYTVASSVMQFISRKANTLPYDLVDDIIPLPDDLVAFVSKREGISIGNMNIAPKTLGVDSPWYGSKVKGLAEFFFCANPDVERTMQIRSKYQLAYYEGYHEQVILSLRSVLADKRVDIFYVDPNELALGIGNGFFVELGADPYLTKANQQLYPAYQQAIQNYAVPLLANPNVWWSYDAGWERLGIAVPRTIDAFSDAIRSIGDMYLAGKVDSYSVADEDAHFYSAWLMESYATQYANSDQPLNYDTEAFRRLLHTSFTPFEAYPYPEPAPLANDYVKNEMDLIKIAYSWEDAANNADYKPMIPPVFDPHRTERVYGWFSSYAISRDTDAMPEAIRFLSFISQNRDAVSQAFLFPTEATDIYTSTYASYLDLVETGWKPEGVFTLNTLRLTSEQQEIYRDDLLPKLICHLGGDYHNMARQNFYEPPEPAADYYSSPDVSSSEVIVRMNALAAEEFDRSSR